MANIVTRSSRRRRKSSQAAWRNVERKKIAGKEKQKTTTTRKGTEPKEDPKKCEPYDGKWRTQSHVRQKNQSRGRGEWRRVMMQQQQQQHNSRERVSMRAAGPPTPGQVDSTSARETTVCVCVCEWSNGSQGRTGSFSGLARPGRPTAFPGGGGRTSTDTPAASQKVRPFNRRSGAGLPVSQVIHWR